MRALKRLSGPTTTIAGIDHSTALIDTARRLTTDEELGENVSYDVGDAHHTPYDDDEFDIITLHTVISHVDDPLQVLHEARRIVRPGGTVAIFDGDYASLTFAYPDHLMAKTIEEKLIQLIVANPRIMRDMPRFVADAGLELVDSEGSLYANIGSGGFWLAAAESYGPLLARSGLLTHEIADEWRDFQVRSSGDNTFFGASNYYTYLMRRPRPGTRIQPEGVTARWYRTVRQGAWFSCACVTRVRRRASSSAICDDATQCRVGTRRGPKPEGSFEARGSFVVVAGGEMSLAEVLDQHGLAVGSGVVNEQLFVLCDCLIVFAEVTSDVGAQGSPSPVVGVGLEKGRQRNHGGVRVTAPQRDEHFECWIRGLVLPETLLVGDDGSQRRRVDVPSGGRVVHLAEGTRRRRGPPDPTTGPRSATRRLGIIPVVLGRPAQLPVCRGVVRSVRVGEERGSRRGRH